MADAKKRIILYQEKTTVDNSDYVLTDSSTNGTKKYQVTRILTEAEATAQTKVDAEAAARAAADNELKDDLKELQDGGYVADQQKIEEKIDAWLDEHPEATTTVQDGSLTIAKMVRGTLGYITPEMFGAVGDGVTDDTEAIERLLQHTVYNILFEEGTYLVSKEIETTVNHRIIGNNATIKFSEDTVVTDLRLLKFNGLSELYVDSLNFEIKCTNNTPYIDSPDPNTGGILVACVNCSNVTFNNCKMKIIDNGTPVQVTCCWPTGTGENYVFNNCELLNNGNTIQGGCLWLFGTIKNVYLNNCKLINSTSDEVVITWGGSSDTDVTINNCYIKVVRENTQIFAANDEHAKMYINNSIIEQNKNNICYETAKAQNGGKIYFDNCKLNLYGRGTNKQFFTLADGEIAVSNCIINHESLDNNDNALICLNNGTIVFEKNRINLTGTKLCFLIVNSNANDSVVHLFSNVIEFNKNVSNYFYGYKETVASNNVMIGYEYNFSSYESYATQVTRTKKITDNTFLCASHGTFWDDTGLKKPIIDSYSLGVIQSHSSKTISIGTPVSYYDMRIVTIVGIGPQRYSCYLLTPSENRTAFVANKISGTDPVVCTIENGDLVITINSDYKSSDTYVLITKLWAII